MHTTSPQTSPRAFYIYRIFFLRCLYLRSPESTNIMHSRECIMFQYKMNIFEAGTYLLLSIEFSAYRIEIHLQQTWTFARKSLWNSIYWILLDLRWQWWSKDGTEEGGGCRRTSKDFAEEMKSTRLNKCQTVQSQSCFRFRFHARVYYVLCLSQGTLVRLCLPLLTVYSYYSITRIYFITYLIFNGRHFAN